MSRRAETIDRIRDLLGATVGYRGASYRLVELLEETDTVILEAIGPRTGIVEDSYGHPASRGPEFIELSLFDETGELSDEIRLVSLNPDPA